MNLWHAFLLQGLISLATLILGVWLGFKGTTKELLELVWLDIKDIAIEANYWYQDIKFRAEQRRCQK